MHSFLFSEEWLVRAFLIWIRTSTIFMVAPFFAHTLIPASARILIALGVSFSLAGVVPLPIPALEGGGAAIVVAIAQQLGAGFILGFVARIVFAGIEVAGQVVGTQAGFSLINIIDPQTSVENSLIGVYLNMLALVLFLAWNGHHILIRALIYSFDPQVSAVPGNDVWLTLAYAGGELFVIGLKVVAPLYALMIITDVILGLAGKIAPQIPILIIGFPVKLLLGIMGLSLCLYFFSGVVEKVFTEQMAWLDTEIFRR